MWDKEFLDELALSFLRIFSEKTLKIEDINVISQLDNPFNQIIKIIFSLVSKKPPKESELFILAFQDMVNLLSKIPENNKIIVNIENIEFANDLGTFGKNTESRRYSVFFCVGIIRVTFSDYKKYRLIGR